MQVTTDEGQYRQTQNNSSGKRKCGLGRSTWTGISVLARGEGQRIKSNDYH